MNKHGNDGKGVSGRGGSRVAPKSKMERFVIIVNGFQPLTVITKRSMLDVAVVLDQSLGGHFFCAREWFIARSYFRNLSFNLRNCCENL